MKPTRKSNMELFRIVAILMVITLHYFARIDTVHGSFEFYFLSVFRYLSIIGVNCFVLISGYFSVGQQRLKLRKIIDIFVTVALLGAMLYAISIMIGINQFDFKVLINEMCPMIKGGLWYIRVYLVLLLLSPFINKALKAMSKKSYYLFLAIMFLVFSIWPSFLPHPIDELCGYSIIHFVFLYSIGAYIKLHYSRKTNKYVYLLFYLVFSGITLLIYYFKPVQTFQNYDFSPTILASVTLLLFFVNCTIQSRIINMISAPILGIYVIHEGGCLQDFVWNKIIRINQSVFGFEFVLKYFVVLLGIFIASYFFVTIEMQIKNRLIGYSIKFRSLTKTLRSNRTKRKFCV